MEMNHMMAAKIAVYLRKGYKVVIMPYTLQAWVYNGDEFIDQIIQLDTGTMVYMLNVYFAITRVEGAAFVLETQKGK